MFIIGIIIGAIVVIFILQNVIPVSIVFLGWQLDSSLAVLIILAMLAGVIISWMLSLPDIFRMSDLQSHNKRLQKDLDIHKQKLSESEGKLSQAEKPIIVEKTVIVEKE